MDRGMSPFHRFDILEEKAMIFEKVAEMLADYKGIDVSTIAPESTFADLELDSLDVADLVMQIEDALGVTAQKNFLPLQDGDVPATYADTAALNAWTGFAPATSVRDGVGRFVAWYREYYKV